MMEFLRGIYMRPSLQQYDLVSALSECHARPSTTCSGTHDGNVVLLHSGSEHVVLGMIAAREVSQIGKAFIFEYVNQSHAGGIERVYSHLLDEAIHGESLPRI